MIRAIVRKGVGEYGHEFVGYRDGWRGPMEGDLRPLEVAEVRGILPRGGTILGSSRTNPFSEEGGADRVRATLEGDGVDGLIAIGGEDTLGVATKLAEAGVPVVGVPKTIDNDLGATDYTFGFDTAVNIAMGSIDRLHTTAESHKRTLIVEVMGRHAGWIALHAGLAGGANIILIPEQPFDLARVCDYIERRFESQYAPIVVVSEGAEPKGGVPIVDEGADRRLRPRAPRRHRPVAGGRDPGANRSPGPGDGAGPRPARRNPDRVRPRAGDPLRAARHRRGALRRVGEDDRASRHRHRPDGARGGDRRAQARAAWSSTARQRSSSADASSRRPRARSLVALLAGCGSSEAAGDAALTVYRQRAADRARCAGRPGGCRRRPCGAREGRRARPAACRSRWRFSTSPTSDAPWSPVASGANARTATEDSTSIAYVGELESGATRTSLPITNDAEMLQIAPGSPAADLVGPFEGSDEVPEETQPSGLRTFGPGRRGSDPERAGYGRWRSRWTRSSAPTTRSHAAR